MQLPSETAEQRTLTGAAFNRRSSNRHPRPIAETGLGRDVDRKVVKLRWQSPFENKPAAEVLYYLAQIHQSNEDYQRAGIWGKQFSDCQALDSRGRLSLAWH